MVKVRMIRARDENGVEDIRERAFAFAVRVVNLCQYLDEKPGVGRTLARQLLRAGTSIGANLEEAVGGQSKADFISKNAIALKEARETSYWLRLLVASEVVPEARVADLLREVEELMRIIGAIIVTAKRLNI
jgi:four helix bundle protein